MDAPTSALIVGVSAQWAAVTAVWINHRTVGPLTHGDVRIEPAGAGPSPGEPSAGRSSEPERRSP